MKPMLACDANESKILFPILVQPKIDGVRAMHLTDKGLTGRSGKQHKNQYTTNYFSRPIFLGLDGEMAADEEIHPRLVSLTTSALNTIEGRPWLMWHVFDYITKDTMNMPYKDRYSCLQNLISYAQKYYPVEAEHLKIVPIVWAYNLENLRDIDAYNTDKGYEGAILRDPNGLYKQGRSTVREGGLLRIKHFVEEEFVIEAIEEGQTNGNEATLDDHGYTERSTHQENMTPNGMVGAFLGTDVKTGKQIKVAAGKLTHEERVVYFKDQSLVLGHIGKYKTFLHGVKDKPRFPTFQSLKIESDI